MALQCPRPSSFLLMSTAIAVLAVALPARAEVITLGQVDGIVAQPGSGNQTTSGSIRIVSTRDLTVTPPDGTVTINAGSVVTLDSDAGTQFVQVDIGRLPGQTGTLTIEGTGSALNVGGDGDGEFVRIGRVGQGVASVRNGGALTVTDDEAFISIGRGDLTVLPGSTVNDFLFNDPPFDAGNPPVVVEQAAQSSLSVENGGTVTVSGGANSGISIGSSGARTNANGKVLVDGPTSRVDAVGGSISIGTSGLGEAVVQNGGTLTSTGTIEVGGAGATGIVEVTSGSTVAIDEGNGELNLRQGATLKGDGGTIDGSVVQGTGAALDLGLSGLTVTGDFTVGGDPLVFDILGRDLFDVLGVGGDFIVPDALALVLRFGGGFAPETGTVFDVITVEGDVPSPLEIGTIDIAVLGLTPDAMFAFEQSEGGGYQIRTIVGGTSTSTVIPLPPSAVIMLGALGALALAGRRRAA